MKKFIVLISLFFAALLLVPGNVWSETQLSDKVALGGVIEVEAGSVSDDLNGDGSGIELATVELGLDAKIAESVEGHIIFLYEEGEDFTVDEGTITLTSPYGLTVTAGNMYIPFGMFNSHFISDPQTLELGETNESAILIAYGSDMFDISIGAFNGDFDDVNVGDAEGADDKVDDFVVSLTVTPAEGISFGASYISDIADTDAELGEAFQNISGEVYTDVYEDVVAGYSAFVSASFGSIVIEAEYLAAADEFDPLDIDTDGDGNGDQPVTFNVEVAYAVSDALEVAARYEGNEDFFDMPEKQYGVALAYGLHENTTLTFEYLTGEYDNVASDKVSSVTAQLAVEF